MGSLYKDDLSLKWTGVRIFVVDVLFQDPGTGCSANFLFDASSFSSLRICKVPSFEKLSICAEICPGLFVQGYIPEPRIGTAFWKQSHKTPPQDTFLEEEHMNEMNRRERWDRTYEKRMRPLKNLTRFDEDDEEALKALVQEKKEEEERRLKWDESHKGGTELGKRVNEEINKEDLKGKPPKRRFGLRWR